MRVSGCVCLCVYASVFTRQFGADGGKSAGYRKRDLVGWAQEGSLDEEEQCRWSGLMEGEATGVEG